jgi:hypothetical protein
LERLLGVDFRGGIGCIGEPLVLPSGSPKGCFLSYLKLGCVLMISWVRIADIVAGMVHGFFYFIVPPWQENAQAANF